ncbi:MAG: hypothetical protein U5Q44_14910 [Dehalococcoidia bacterium]|nr:hypothetical protein [Dehalococcoidia bacterium]
MPFLISALAFGVISALIFVTATIVLTIPVFATRGRTQAVWAGITGLILLAIGVVLIVLTIMVGQGELLS